MKLTEIYQVQPKIEKIGVTDAVNLLNKHCKKNGLEAVLNDSMLFRGFGSHVNGPASIIDTANMVRTSASSNNEYMLMMNNSTALKEFPSRSNSVICSTSANAASEYGDLYAVVPFDGTNIVKSNIYDFIGEHIIWGKREETVSDFAEELLGAFRGLGRTPSLKSSMEFYNNAIREDTAENFLVRLERHMPMFGSPGVNNAQILKLLKTPEPFTSLISFFFTPEKLKIQLVPFGDKIKHNVECWFSGKFLAIKYDIYNNMVKQIKEQR